jgi:hypothetical protein
VLQPVFAFQRTVGPFTPCLLHRWRLDSRPGPQQALHRGSDCVIGQK